MKITHIASECAPFAKSGGLGDVVYGLSRMTLTLGHTVKILIPNYKSHEEKIEKELFDSFPIRLDGESFDVRVYKAIFHEIEVYTIDSTHSKNLFQRDSIYGENDDPHRFLCFCYFALSFLSRHLSESPDILHLHDWPTGFSSCFLKFLFPDLNKRIKGTLFTIHNLKYQGIVKKNHLDYFNLNPDLLPVSYNQMDNSEYLNIAKAAIEEAKVCVVVSNTYLNEIKTPIAGEGLQDFIKERSDKFFPILNGIDTDFWNPEKDPYIHKNYRTNELIDSVIEAKYLNKHHLQKQLNLARSHAPLFIFVTRLVEQKGPYLIFEAIQQILKRGGQAVLLGSEPSKELKSLFESISDKENLYLDFTFQEKLSHLCFAAADAIVIPSLFEPCGLTQLIGMRYGTIPVVRKTGGLSDTVFDIEHSSLPLHLRNGFVFEYPTLDSMDYIINRTIDCYKNNPSTWKSLIKNCLNNPVGFQESAKKYLYLYEMIIS